MTLLLALHILAIIALFALSAFFSGSETAFTFLDEVSLSRLVRENKLREKDKKLWKRSTEVLTALLVGNNIVNNILAVLVTLLATNIAKMTVGLSEELSITFFTTFLIVAVLIFSEVFPKTYARTHTMSVASLTTTVVKTSLFLFRPFTRVLMSFTNIMLKRLASVTNKQNKGSNSTFASVEDIETVISLGLKEGIIKQQTHDLLAGIIQFRSKKVEEAMIPRVDMECIDSETTVDDIIKLAMESGYSRFPVYEETVDHIIGVLSIKSVMKDYIKNKRNTKAIKHIMLPYFVPEGKLVKDLFNDMQIRKLHMAIVIDEYGGTAGLITLEDILEEIVGEIEDEHEKETLNVQARGKKYIVKGTTPLDEINERLKIKLEHDEFQTIAGYILETLGYIPQKNERIKMNGYLVKIRKMDERRIVELEFIKIKK